MLTNKLFPGGSEGRCSFNGRVMTVFGANGNLGTNVVAELGKKGTQMVIPHRCTYHDATFLKLAGDLGQVHLIVLKSLNKRISIRTTLNQ
ncbi:hypothetical protein MXB_618 [Myxobolus squamalis]|nr:hypothetical protein MXB_618 [Myxobolus squamalis]